MAVADIRSSNTTKNIANKVQSQPTKNISNTPKKVSSDPSCGCPAESFKKSESVKNSSIQSNQSLLSKHHVDEKLLAKQLNAQNSASGSSSARSSSESVSLQTSPKVAQAYEGLEGGTASVTVDGWKKGPNDCLVHILEQKGYTSQEIYKKDESGRSLIDRVAEANGLKDPNVIQAGSTLTIPTKGETVEHSSHGLKEGQERTVSSDKGDGFGIETTTSVSDKGNVQAEIRHVNEDQQGGHVTTADAGQGGKIVGATTITEDKHTSVTHVSSASGTAHNEVVSTNERSGHQSTTHRVHAGTGEATVSDTEARVTTTSANGKEQVTTATNYDEREQDGFFENTARDIAETFGYGSQEQEARELEGVARTEVTSEPNQGGTTIRSYDNDGNLIDTRHVAGDSDDTLLERGGEVIDRGVEAVGRGVQATGRAIVGAGTAVKNAAGQAVDVAGRAIGGAVGWVTSWFN